MATSLSVLDDRRADVPPQAVAALTGPDGRFAAGVEEVLGTTLPVFTRRHRNLPRVLEAAATAHPERPFVVDAAAPDGTGVLTYAPARELIVRRAGQLAARGVRPGDRVAIASANRTEYVLCAWATLYTGAVTVGMNGWWTGAELEYATELVAPALLLADGPRRERLTDRTRDMTTVVSFEELASVSVPEENDPPVPHDADEDAAAVILFTSGTTGRAKGAVLSHRSLVHFAMSSALNGALNAGSSGLRPAAVAAGGGSVLMASPFFHISGSAMMLVAGPWSGLTLVIPEAARWDEHRHLELLARHRITSWSGVPTQYWRLLECEGFSAAGLPDLRTLGAGGAVFPPKLVELVAERFPGVTISSGYGMSETFGLGTLLSGAQMRAHPDSLGRPTPLSQAQVRDPLGVPVPEGETGEIWLRNASVFLGYWNDDKATADVLDDERWYRTGDFGRIEHGLLFLDSRLRDIVIRGGENVYPVEVENRLVAHPDVVDAAVIGVPHPVLGQEVKAVVVARPESGLTAEQVREWTAVELAAFKVPAYVEFRTALPYSATGKVLKRELETGSAATDTP
ncbi:class I adenylate-forming enzyme family protein [Yinghuangia sp. YIM S09857]|uniref:class I adenylate-forming enzyme family protein n=1 Tax=Yinghuangia sp. YIM S09857 TaxID=3436929 RepID=UPI003F52E44B